MPFRSQVKESKLSSSAVVTVYSQRTQPKGRGEISSIRVPDERGSSSVCQKASEVGIEIVQTHYLCCCPISHDPLKLRSAAANESDF